MKKIVLFLMVLFNFCIFPTLIWATPRTVTITWTMPYTTNVQGYKVYYADNNAMSNKIWHSDCSSPTENPTDTFSIACNNIDLADEQTYYFSIAAVLNDGSESNSIPHEATVATVPITITKVKNFKVTTVANSPTAPTYAINFQPANSPTLSGFLVDSGLTFDSSRNYGWTTDTLNFQLKDRNLENIHSPDQAYDTIIFTPTDAIWEIAVPNGTYRITVCMGDPLYPTAVVCSAQAEGSSVISNVELNKLSSENRWAEGEIIINITDQKLTLTFSGSTNPVKLCWVKIIQE